MTVFARSARASFDQANIMFEAQSADIFAGAKIRHEGIHLGNMSNPDRCIALEFRRVGNQYNIAGIFDNGLRDLHFANIKVQQGTVMVNCG